MTEATGVGAYTAYASSGGLADACFEFGELWRGVGHVALTDGRGATVMLMRMAGDTQREVAGRLGVCRRRVAQIEAAVWRRARWWRAERRHWRAVAAAINPGFPGRQVDPCAYREGE